MTYIMTEYRLVKLSHKGGIWYDIEEYSGIIFKRWRPYKRTAISMHTKTNYTDMLGVLARIRNRDTEEACIKVVVDV